MLWWDLRRLNSKNADVRASAVRSISRSSSQRAFHALVGSLSDSRDEVREAAARGLESFGAQAIDPLIAFLSSTSPLGTSTSSRDRGAAAETLGKLKATRAVDSLLAILESDKNELTVRVALEALGNIGDQRAVDVVASKIRDTVYGNLQACTAVRAFAAIGGPRAVPLLVEHLSEGKDGIRVEVIRALVAKDVDSVSVERCVQGLRKGTARDRERIVEILKVRGWKPRGPAEVISHGIGTQNYKSVASQGIEGIRALEELYHDDEYHRVSSGNTKFLIASALYNTPGASGRVQDEAVRAEIARISAHSGPPA